MIIVLNQQKGVSPSSIIFHQLSNIESSGLINNMNEH